LPELQVEDGDVVAGGAAEVVAGFEVVVGLLGVLGVQQLSPLSQPWPEGQDGVDGYEGVLGTQQLWPECQYQPLDGQVLPLGGEVFEGVVDTQQFLSL